MRSRIWVLVMLSVLVLTAGCGRGEETGAVLPSHPPQLADSAEPTLRANSRTADPAPVCPPGRGMGTVAPAVSIYSITFVVNGVEQVVRDGDTLQARPGDEVQLREATICAGSFSTNGGEACVDLAPADQAGKEIVSAHRGTHTVPVTRGFISISGPGDAWTIGENWGSISVVLNHWPPEGTEDPACGSGRCERDDRMVVGFR